MRLHLFNNNSEVLPPEQPVMVENLRELLYTSAERFGDRTRYLYRGKDGDYHPYSFNRLRDEVNAIGTALFSLGLGSAAVAVTGDVHPRYIAAYFAGVTGGGCIVPIDRDISPEQTANFIAIPDVKAIFYTKAQNKKMAAIADQMPSVQYFIPIQPEENYKFFDKVMAIDDLIALGKREIINGNRDFIDLPQDIEKMSALLFTSGTTGTSKGVMLSQKNLTASSNAASLALAPIYNSKTHLVSVLPPHHSYEMTCMHLAALDLGCEILINDSLKHVVKNFGSYKPNALVLVPLFVETMHKKIWDEVGKKRLKPELRLLMKVNSGLVHIGIDFRKYIFKAITNVFGGNLRSIVCGGAAISPSIVRDFYDFGITILEGYGITECSPLVAVNNPGKVRFRSVGQPVYGCEVRIDQQNPDDKTGEICVKGDNVMLGYYNNPEATAEAFTEDGWFRTGDIGYIDEDGYIFITGRKKSVIILSNGKNIFPEELEEHLAPVSEILESVIVSRNIGGQAVLTAVVVPDMSLFKGKNENEIYTAIKEKVDAVNRTLPTYKQIRKVELRFTPFERTTSKKIIRYKVK